MVFNVKQRFILIADSDRQFLEAIKADPKALITRPLLTTTGKEAQQVLSDSETALAALFVNMSLTTPEGGPGAQSVMRFARQMRPQIPIFVLYNTEQQFDSLKPPVEIEVRKLMIKPIAFSKMIELVLPAAILFDSRAAKELAQMNPDQLGQEIHQSDDLFSAIIAKDFLSGSETLFNLYVRINPNRYVKILHAGERFDPDRIKTYLDKHVSYFYIRNSDQREYLKYCNQIAGSVSLNEKMSTDFKVRQVLHQGEQTMSFLRQNGLSPENLSFANSFIANVRTLVDQMGIGQNEYVKKLMGNFLNYDHGVSTTMIACLVAKSAYFESESIVQIIGLSSLLHDVGLEALPQELHHEDEALMTVEQRKLYRTHPEKGAGILQSIPGMPGQVVQAVGWHHQRRTKDGFPKRAPGIAMNRVAEIIGISEEYAKLIRATRENKAESKIDPLQLMNDKIVGGFTHTLVDSFRSVFLRI